jgi:hypothetical protein
MSASKPGDEPEEIEIARDQRLWRAGAPGLYYAESISVADRYDGTPALFQPVRPLQLLAGYEWEDLAEYLDVDFVHPPDLLDELKASGFDGARVQYQEHPGGLEGPEVMLTSPALVEAVSAEENPETIAAIKGRLLR